ncbi:MAG: CbiX/SirB N-terminal domain-containing protein [Halobacteriaceae archaeon]
MSEALVVVAHGSHLNPDASDPTYAHADTIRDAGAFAEVREAFWKEEPSPREVLRTVESDEVYVVPLFISEGYFTEQVIPRELRLEGWAGWGSDGTSADHVTLTAADVDKTVHYCGPVGTHAAMTDVVVQRATSVTGDPDVGQGVGIAVVGHGTERNENSAKAVYQHAEAVRARDRFEEVRALFMDEEPEVDDVTEHFTTDDVVVVPLFVADGYHTQEDIPEDMGIAREGVAGAAGEPADPTAAHQHVADYDVPATVDGTRIWYAGAVGTEPLTAEVLLERAADAGADVEDAIERVRTATGGTDPEVTHASVAGD